MQKLSIIIPAYNEEHRITGTLESLNQYLQKQPYDYEILVVVDGAKDKTAEVVSEISSKIAKLRLIANTQNHGKGFVVKQGMLEATGDARLFMDADNSTSIDQVEAMLKHLAAGYDIIIGSIEVEGAQINEKAQWYRRFLGHWSKYLIRIVAGLWNIHDTQRGFKLFTEKAAKEVFSKATIERFGFDIEILAIANHKGLKIKEVPVVWNNAGESTVTFGSYFKVLMDLFRVRLNLWRGKYR
jgi:glycosyltransferase involved in cell wall biosynthesis